MRKVKVGFLPLYIKLYDDGGTDRSEMERCMETAASMLEAEGLEVLRAGVCRIKPEFEAAAESFRAADVDAVVTLHLAYSPSLESIDALCSVPAPVVVCDTTITYDMSVRMDHRDVTPNHGIHGVMDMCNLLKRRGKPYVVEAGHLTRSDVVARAAGHCRAAAAAKAFRSGRVGSMGGSFEGMGDFFRTAGDMKQDFGADVIYFDFERDYALYRSQITEGEIDAELERDAGRFTVEAQNLENYRAATRMGLTLRKWAQANRLNAYTVNFLSMERDKMPFLEISKAMMEGMGYAGEGDVLTANLVGALMRAYRDVTFTETFCPCWDRGLILMSHMGEMNLNLSAFRPVVADAPFSYTPSGDTVAAYGSFRGGRAVFVNLAPMDGGRYTLLLAPVEMLDIAQEYGSYRYTVEGWMKPPMPLADYLKAFSTHGGTHHSALVYDADIRELESFGAMMGFHVVKLG